MNKEQKEEVKVVENETVSKTCGIIIPISPHPDYSNDHWSDVLAILVEAVSETDFEPRLVSDDVAIGLIHDRIVRNIYTNEIVVCDVSSKNPNVMFELGLRLAFDKPTIIVKDELTGYSFDTGVIEHIPYPSSLSFKEIVKFKIELSKRINATYQKSVEEPHFSPFLKSFGKNIIPATIQQKDVPEGKYILSMFERMREEMQILRVEQRAFLEKVVTESNTTRSIDKVERTAEYMHQLKRYEIEMDRLRRSNEILQVQNTELHQQLASKSIK